MKKLFLLVLIVMTFAGCATEEDPDRLSWDDVKDRATSMFGQDSSAVTQAQADMQKMSEEQDPAASKF